VLFFENKIQINFKNRYEKAPISSKTNRGFFVLLKVDSKSWRLGQDQKKNDNRPDKGEQR
jgi:hypothetical protein